MSNKFQCESKPETVEGLRPGTAALVVAPSSMTVTLRDSLVLALLDADAGIGYLVHAQERSEIAPGQLNSAIRTALDSMHACGAVYLRVTAQTAATDGPAASAHSALVRAVRDELGIVGIPLTAEDYLAVDSVRVHFDPAAQGLRRMPMDESKRDECRGSIG